MSKLELYLNKIVKYGLYAILLMPLAFWPRALYGFLTPKFILFQILVEIVFAAWLALLAFRNTNTRMHTNDTNNADYKYSRHSYINSCHLYWRKWLTIALFGFFGVSLISAIFGVDFSRSFWGIGARMTGLFAELHFLAWFLVLVSTLRSGSTRMEADQRGNFQHKSALNPRLSASTYLNFSFFVSIVVALTAFFQSSLLALSPGLTIFNNPTFVAPYLILHFFWGIYQTLASSLHNTNIRMDTNNTNKNSYHSYDNSYYLYWKNWLFGGANGKSFWFTGCL